MKKLFRKTPRLEVRLFKSADFRAWRQAHLNMSSPKNIWDHGPREKSTLTRKDFSEVLRRQRENQKLGFFYDFGVFDHHGQLLGAVALMEIRRAISQTCYLGYRIFNNHWGQGFAKEAVEAVLDIGFKDLALHRIEAGIEPQNKRSLRLARSLGMRREGLKKRSLFVRNQWVDLAIYTLTTEDLGIKFDATKLVRLNRL